jgi:hypothetical protein
MVGAACLLLLRTPGASGASTDEPGHPFGPRIIDIALTVDRAAVRSLIAFPGSDVRGRMSFDDATGVPQTYNVKIHIKGQKGSARALDAKPAFKVKLGGSDRFFGLEHLTLNNMVQDPTMMHEAIGYQVYEAAGVLVPATGYARVSFNGQAYGLYLNVETIDRRFLKRQFGDDGGIMYEAAYGVDLRAADAGRFELQEGKDPGRAQLKTLIRALDAPGDDVFYGRNPLVDAPSFLGMIAAGTLLEDWDNYYRSNNYRIYWNPSAGRWVFIPTGIDQTFVPNSTTVFGATGLLFQKCLSSERCTEEYAAKVREVADRFEGLGLPARIDALLAVIGAASQEDPKKAYDAAKMDAARDAMRVFIATRPDQVRAALRCGSDGSAIAGGACAGVVIVNRAGNSCLEVVRRSAARNGGGIGATRCDAATNHRWHLVARGNAFALTSVGIGSCLAVQGSRQDQGAPVEPSSCAGTDNQLFSLVPIAPATQLVAKHSGKCVAVASRRSEAAPFVQVSAAQDAAQTWRVQRSIYP